jgi:hypothetical protein
MKFDLMRAVTTDNNTITIRDQIRQLLFAASFFVGMGYFRVRFGFESCEDCSLLQLTTGPLDLNYVWFFRGNVP